MTDKDQRGSSGLDGLDALVNDKRFSRRSLLKGAAAVGAAAAIGPIASACGSSGDTTRAVRPAAGTPNKGGDLMVGIVGGSAKDTADPHTGSFEPDIAIQYIMYEGLTAWDFDLKVTNLLAETIEPNTDGRSGRSSCGTGSCGTTASPSPPTTSCSPWTVSSIPRIRRSAPPLSPASGRRHEEGRRQDGRDHPRRRRTCCWTRTSPNAAARSCRWASTPRTLSAAARSRWSR